MTDIELPLGKRTPLYRLWEIIPGAVSYTILALPILLSLIDPLWGALFVVLFIITWFVKAVGLSYRTVQGYNRLQVNKKRDWGARLRDLEDIDAALARLKEQSHPTKADMEHYKNLCVAAAHRDQVIPPKQMLNAVIIAFYNEDREVLEPTITAPTPGNAPQNCAPYAAAAS